MPITSEQAYAELARRELSRRSVTSAIQGALSRQAAPQAPTADFNARTAGVIEGAVAGQAAGTPVPQGPTTDFVAGTPRSGGTLLGDLYHAVGRGGIKGIAAVPGALASLMETSETIPVGGPYAAAARTVDTSKAQDDLRKQAHDIYKLSDAESLRARRGGAAGFLVNLVGETVPQFGVSAVAAMIGGPVGVVATSAVLGGEEVYQNLIDLGVSHEKADAARWVTAPIIGLVEKWQIDGVLRIGNKAAVKRLVQAARERAFKKMAVAGVDITFEHTMKAAGEGLQEVIQEATGIGAEVALARDFDPKADLIRLGSAGLGGAIVGEFTGGGISMARGGASIVGEVKRQSDVAHLRRNAQPLDPPSVDTPIAAPAPGEASDALTQATGPTEVVSLAPEGQEALSAAAERASADLPPMAPVGDETVGQVPTDRPGSVDPQQGAAFNNASLDQRAQAMGLPAAPEMTPRGTVKERQEQAVREGWAAPSKARAVAADILENPRPATDLESHGMNAALITLKAEANGLNDQLVKLPVDSVEYKEAKQKWDDVRRDYETIYQIGKWSGTEWHATGMARQEMLDDNGDVLGVLARAKDTTGADLTPALENDLKRRVRSLRKARTTADTSGRTDAKNRLRDTAKKITKLGRLAKMTDADKDAQLQDLLGREQTDIVLTDIVMNLASRDPKASIDSVVKKVREYLPAVTHTNIVDAFDGAQQRKTKNTFGMEYMLRNLRKQLKKEKHKLTSIDDVLYWLKEGRLPDSEADAVDLDDKVVRDLQVVLGQVKKLQKDSEPWLQRKLEKQIAYLNARLAAKDFGNRKQAYAFKPGQHTLKLQYEAAKLNAEIGRRIVKLRNKQHGLVRRGSANVARSIMSMKSSFDDSGLFNQGGFAVLGHPIKGLKTIPKAFSAALSDKRAFFINQEILARANAPLYQKYGLGLTQASDASTFTEREEEHRESLADSIPGIKASNRAFATTLNILRADSFDAMAGAFASESGLTDIDGQAIADFVNMSTGRGNIRGIEGTVNTLNGVLWAPRRTISSFQMIATLGGQLEYHHKKGESHWRPEVHLRGSRHVRRMMAQEVARYLLGYATVAMLGMIAGAEFEWDMLSSDFGKQRYGRLRLDPTSGFAQAFTMIKRLAYTQRKAESGEIQDLSGYDMDRLLQRFARYKLSPALGIAWSSISRQTAFDGPFTWQWAAKEVVTPLSLDDVLKAADDQGIPRGIIFSTFGFFGMAVQVYGDNATSASTVSRRGAL